MDMIEATNNLNGLIEEELKRECIGTDQSNQCTLKVKQYYFNILK